MAQIGLPRLGISATPPPPGSVHAVPQQPFTLLTLPHVPDIPELDKDGNIVPKGTGSKNTCC